MSRERCTDMAHCGGRTNNGASSSGYIWIEIRAVLQLVCGILSIGLSGFYFHPSDEDLSLGTPVDEKAT